MQELVFRIKEAFVSTTCIFCISGDLKHGLQPPMVFKESDWDY